MVRSGKKSYEEKLSWLRKNNIVLKKEKMRESTVNRLFSFYQRNPLDTPRNLAYGLPKRLEKKLEIEDGTKTTVHTPKGNISTKDYIKIIDKRSIRKAKKQLHEFQFIANRRFKKKMEDSFLYSLRDGKGIIISALTAKNVMKQLRTTDIPDLIELLKRLFKTRGFFYKGRLVGAIVHYKTEGMDAEPHPRGVAFTSLNNFGAYLYDMLYAMLIDELFRKESTKDGVVKLTYIEIGIRTKTTMSNVERLVY